MMRNALQLRGAVLLAIAAFAALALWGASHRDEPVVVRRITLPNAEKLPNTTVRLLFHNTHSRAVELDATCTAIPSAHVLQWARYQDPVVLQAGQEVLLDYPAIHTTPFQCVMRYRYTMRRREILQLRLADWLHGHGLAWIGARAVPDCVHWRTTRCLLQ